MRQATEPTEYQQPKDFGALEPMLSVLRTRKALTLLPRSLGAGRILDVGCGLRSPLLKRAPFAQRYGLDRRVARSEDAAVVAFDLGTGHAFPFMDGSFEAVTMLAALEHLERRSVPFVVSEIRRVMRTGGFFVLTTPARWTGGVLTAMARAHLVSPREIDEHKHGYTGNELRSLLTGAGFDEDDLAVGRFQFGANLWARARRTAR